MKKIIVILTGGLGFIGSNLVELLIKKNLQYLREIDNKNYIDNKIFFNFLHIVLTSLMLNSG